MKWVENWNEKNKRKAAEDAEIIALNLTRPRRTGIVPEPYRTGRITYKERKILWKYAQEET